MSLEVTNVKRIGKEQQVESTVKDIIFSKMKKLSEKSKLADSDPRGPYHVPDPDPKIHLWGDPDPAQKKKYIYIYIFFILCPIHESRDNQHFRIKIVKKAYILWF